MNNTDQNTKETKNQIKDTFKSVAKNSSSRKNTLVLEYMINLPTIVENQSINPSLIHGGLFSVRNAYFFHKYCIQQLFSKV